MQDAAQGKKRHRTTKPCGDKTFRAPFPHAKPGLAPRCQATFVVAAGMCELPTQHTSNRRPLASPPLAGSKPVRSLEAQRQAGSEKEPPRAAHL